MTGRALERMQFNLRKHQSPALAMPLGSKSLKKINAKLVSVFVYCSKGTHAIALELGGSALQKSQSLQVGKNKTL
jgi:hypothetical protein